jgi:hypothetical protein
MAELPQQLPLSILDRSYLHMWYTFITDNLLEVTTHKAPCQMITAFLLPRLTDANFRCTFRQEVATDIS